jgi:thermitase
VQVTGEDTGQVINRLSEEDLVKYVEPNKLVHALYMPNDPRYPNQWGPQHIKANSAWDIEEGNKNVTIAVIDTGIDYEHEDLRDNYIAGGYDWVNNDSYPMDDHHHGTHCAGIAAATLDNKKGIAGIAQVNLMAEKVLNETGWGTEWDVAQAIVHATDNNGRCLSLCMEQWLLTCCCLRE